MKPIRYTGRRLKPIKVKGRKIKTVNAAKKYNNAFGIKPGPAQKTRISAGGKRRKRRR